MSGADPRLDVIVPARGEAASIEACLKALLLDGDGLRLRVAVVLNGEGAEETGASVARFQPAFAAAGHELIVARSGVGKAEALNAGDALRRRGCPVVYLDADAVVLPGTLRQLREALAGRPEPVLAAPRLRVAQGDAALARAYGRVWAALPIVRDGVIGGGCYAVNAAGRGLWTRFPDISGDDAFVCALFPPERRIALSPAGILVTFPGRWRDLTALRARWLRSALEGAAAARAVRGAGEGDVPAHVGKSRWAALASPGVLSSLPAYAAVDVAARLSRLLRREPARPDWRPLRGGAHPQAPARPRVRVVVVAYNNAAEIAACLASLESRWAALQVVVVDNASADATAAEAARFPGVEVVRETRNLGFAAAVNRAARDLAGVDHVLLVNPDAVLDPGAIDALLAVATRFPAGGLFGARGRRSDGRANPASCLAAPSLGRAMAYAVGLSTGLSLPRAAYRDIFETRPVAAVSGACLLVTAQAWRALEGFDERFFLYGEDVDLCLRARRAGFRPTYTALAGYIHDGGASSATSADRLCRLLAGTIALHSKHGGRLAGVARGLIRAGVIVRALASRVVGDARWPAVWRRRAEWWRGYPAVVERDASAA